MEELKQNETNAVISKTIDYRTCRICHQRFNPLQNSEDACIFHPEFFSGETAQRWLPPGESKGGGEIHNFYTCCGQGITSKGCCTQRHMTFDEPERTDLRRPGMGLIKAAVVSNVELNTDSKEISK